jgi:hypothetical protein
MYPEQQPQSQPQPEQQPPYQPVNGEPAVAPKKSLKWPIILMVWPSASLVLSILLYAIVNAVIASAADPAMFGSSNPARIILNIVIFITGGLALTAGPISFVVGLVLFIQRKSKW